MLLHGILNNKCARPCFKNHNTICQREYTYPTNLYASRYAYIPKTCVSIRAIKPRRNFFPLNSALQRSPKSQGSYIASYIRKPPFSLVCVVTKKALPIILAIKMPRVSFSLQHRRSILSRDAACENPVSYRSGAFFTRRRS